MRKAEDWRDCLSFRLSVFLKASLKERFDWEGAAGPQWQVLEGGRPCTDCGVLVEGTALYFGGADARQAVTADLDLRGAKLELALRQPPVALHISSFSELCCCE